MPGWDPQHGAEDSGDGPGITGEKVLALLASAVGLSVGAVIGGLEIAAEIARDPTGFVLGHVVAWVVGGILIVAGYTGELILSIFGVLGSAILSIGGAVLIVAVAIAGVLEVVLDLMNGIILELALATGPAAPIAVIVIWGAFAFGVAFALWIASRVALEALRQRPLI